LARTNYVKRILYFSSDLFSSRNGYATVPDGDLQGATLDKQSSGKVLWSATAVRPDVLKDLRCSSKTASPHRMKCSSCVKICQKLSKYMQRTGKKIESLIQTSKIFKVKTLPGCFGLSFDVICSR
jgi:hypothetical protein